MNLQNISDQHANQPTKKMCNILLQPHLTSVEPRSLETNHF
jgi:hypothetical protein